MSKKKQKIKVYFKDGKVDEIPQKFWDNYDYIDHNFIVIKNEQWIAIYNMDIVACIVIG